MNTKENKGDVMDDSIFDEKINNEAEKIKENNIASLSNINKDNLNKIHNKIKSVNKKKILQIIKETFDFSKNARSKTEIQREKEKIKEKKALTTKNSIDLPQNIVIKNKIDNEIDYVYDYINNTGESIIKLGTYISGSFNLLTSIISVYIPHYFRKVVLVLSRFFSKVIESCAAPFKESSQLTVSYKYKYIWNHEKGFAGFKNAVKGLGWYLKGIWKSFSKIIDYILPVLGCSILAACIIYFNDLNYLLEIKNDGEVLGYVSSVSDYYLAENKMKERIIESDMTSYNPIAPDFNLVIVNNKKVTDTDTLTNRILERISSEVVECDGIYIDDVFFGAVENGNEFLVYINSILDEYRKDSDYEKIELQKKIVVKNGIYPISSIKTTLELKNSIESNKSVMKTVKVNDGDTIESIAKENKTTVENIIKLNPKLNTRIPNENEVHPSIYTGETLTVDNVELNLGIKLTKRETYEEDIPFSTDYIDDNRYPTSYTEIVSNGIKGKKEIVSDVVYIDGERVGETRLKETVIQEPKNAVKKRGTLLPQQFMSEGSDKSNSFMWPVEGGRITCGLYGYPTHTGTDIGAYYGAPILASKSGTVTKAFNYPNGAYGKRVDIDHGNGVMTRYAHMSTVLVRPGQYVRQGQLIGYMGATGRAYGVHLHFEVRINGKVMNPEDFIGHRYPGKK